LFVVVRVLQKGGECAGVSNHPIFAQLRAMNVFPSKSTERRHVNLQNTLGHTRGRVDARAMTVRLCSVIKISSSWHSIGLHSLKLQPPRLMFCRRISIMALKVIVAPNANISLFIYNLSLCIRNTNPYRFVLFVFLPPFGAFLFFLLV